MIIMMPYSWQDFFQDKQRERERGSTDMCTCCVMYIFYSTLIGVCVVVVVVWCVRCHMMPLHCVVQV